LVVFQSDAAQNDHIDFGLHGNPRQQFVVRSPDTEKIGSFWEITSELKTSIIGILVRTIRLE
jgi:hypothetical protein